MNFGRRLFRPSLVGNNRSNPTKTMKRFEYRLFDAKRGFFSDIDYQELTEQLNRLGSLGWEAVSTVGATVGGQTTGLLITLKRELPE